ncbi:hypothetical protein THAOC_09731, partial [Thalassiosira oceanica]
PAVHIIHHQAGGREKCSRFNLFFPRPPTLRRQQQQQQQQQQERINAGPEVSTFPDAGPESPYLKYYFRSVSRPDFRADARGGRSLVAYISRKVDVFS